MSTNMESQRQSIAEAIANAPVSEDPFPHVFARDVLPPELMDWMLGHWPADFERDPGEIDRSNFILRGHDGGQRDDPEWQAFTDSIAQQIVDSALAKFSAYNDVRFGADATYSSQIQLLECGPEFTGHPSHSHHNHGPGWAMTFLLYLDDGGRTDRGEVLFAPRAGADWLDVVAQNAVPVVPKKSVPFEPNSLIAWLDGPMSFHGTDVLSRDPINRRKMLRCHVILKEPKVVEVLGAGSLDFLAACRAHARGDSAQLRAILNHPNSCVSAIPRFAFADEPVVEKR